MNLNNDLLPLFTQSSKKFIERLKFPVNGDLLKHKSIDEIE